MLVKHTVKHCETEKIRPQELEWFAPIVLCYNYPTHIAMLPESQERSPLSDRLSRIVPLLAAVRRS